MSLQSFKFLRPRSLRQAVDYLARHGNDLLILAGGTDLLPSMKQKLFTFMRYKFTVDETATPQPVDLEIEGDFWAHEYSFARNGVPAPYAAWKDVVVLLPGDRVTLAVPFADFAGKTVFHCHVARHNDRGMMALLDVVDPTA